jgi:hypothetical protein
MNRSAAVVYMLGVREMMRRCSSYVFLWVGVILFFTSIAWAYNPGPGLWTGWLVLDPWGSMYMFNHCYVYPVNQDIVPKLKQYAGKPCVVEVKKTFELITPGPVRIEDAEYVRPASFGELKDLSLTASVEMPAATENNAAVTLKITNKTKEKVRFIAAQLTVIVLVKGKSGLFTGTNGNSYPHNLYSGRYVRSFDITRQTGRIRVRHETWYDTLDAFEEYTCTVELKLSPGEYYAWGSYGESNFFGPISLMSNGVHFHVPKPGIIQRVKNWALFHIGLVERDIGNRDKALEIFGKLMQSSDFNTRTHSRIEYLATKQSHLRLKATVSVPKKRFSSGETIPVSVLVQNHEKETVTFQCFVRIRRSQRKTYGAIAPRTEAKEIILNPGGEFRDTIAFTSEDRLEPEQWDIDCSLNGIPFDTNSEIIQIVE